MRAWYELGKQVGEYCINLMLARDYHAFISHEDIEDEYYDLRKALSERDINPDCIDYNKVKDKDIPNSILQHLPEVNKSKKRQLFLLGQYLEELKNILLFLFGEQDKRIPYDEEDIDKDDALFKTANRKKIEVYNRMDEIGLDPSLKNIWDYGYIREEFDAIDRAIFDDARFNEAPIASQEPEERSNIKLIEILLIPLALTILSITVLPEELMGIRIFIWIILAFVFVRILLVPKLISKYKTKKNPIKALFWAACVIVCTLVYLFSIIDSNNPIAGDSEISLPKPELTTNIESQSCHLSWTQIDDAKEYIVKRNVNQETFLELYRTADSNYIDEDISYGNEYGYVIDAALSNGNIISSDISTIDFPDTIPEFPNIDKNLFAHVEYIQTLNEKVHLYTMPIDKNEYMLNTGIRPAKNDDVNYVKAFFPENDFVLVELPMRANNTDIENNKQLIYMKKVALDIIPDFPSFTDPANVKGIIINDVASYYFGPGNKYIKDSKHNIQKNTEVTILYKYGDYYFAQYNNSNLIDRIWLPQSAVKIYANQNE